MYRAEEAFGSTAIKHIVPQSIWTWPSWKHPVTSLHMSSKSYILTSLFCLPMTRTDLCRDSWVWEAIFKRAHSLRQRNADGGAVRPYGTAVFSKRLCSCHTYIHIYIYIYITVLWGIYFLAMLNVFAFMYNDRSLCMNKCFFLSRYASINICIYVNSGIKYFLQFIYFVNVLKNEENMKTMNDTCRILKNVPTETLY